MVKLKDLLMDYKFLTTWEEEQVMEINKSGQGRINQESAINNMINLMTPMNEESE